MTTAASPTAPIPRWLLVRMMLMTAAGFTSFAATLSALPAWSASHGASTASAGAATTITLVTTVACQPFVPALLRRMPTPVAIAIGLLALGLPMPALLVSASGPILYTVCAVRGFGFAVFTLAGAAMTGEIAPPGRHGTVTGFYGLAAAVPNLVVSPLSVLLLQTVGFWPLVLVATVVPVLGAALGFTSRSRTAAVDRRGHQRGNIGRAFRSTRAPAAVLCAVTILGGAFVTVLPIDRPTGYLATVGLLVYGATGAVCRWAVGRWADRAGTGRPLVLTCLVALAGIATFASGLVAVHDALLLAGCAMIGAAFGAVQSLTLVAAFARSTVRDRPLSSAFWNAAFDTGTAAGAVLVGVLSGLLGTFGAFAVMAVLVLAAVPAAVASGRPLATDDRDRTPARAS